MTDPATGPVPLEDQLCYAIYSAGIAIQRAYKPLLDKLGLTYPQYLVLNLLWSEDSQTVGGIAGRLALESSTLTPLLKRMETSGWVKRQRDPSNERQVRVELTPKGRALRSEAVCLNNSLLEMSKQTPADLAALNRDIVRLRTAIYKQIDGWNPISPPLN